MTYKDAITQEYLKSILDYNSETGIFIWLHRTLDMFEDDKQSSSHRCNRWNAQYAGTVAGCKNNDGYIAIAIKPKNYRAHILAWLYMTGEFPHKDIDHIDNDPCNNKFINLRLANDSQNHANERLSKNNKSGFKGVYYNKQNKKYRAQIMVNYKKKNLGSYETAEEAHKAYQIAAQELFGEFANFG